MLEICPRLAPDEGCGTAGKDGARMAILPTGERTAAKTGAGASGKGKTAALDYASDPMIAASERVARVLKMMANPVRLRILCLVGEGERPVGEIAHTLGMREAAASQQLAQLRMEGLVLTRKEGQRVLYRLATPEIYRVLSTLREIYCETC
jgi:ArsR family transcriptional regulator